MRVASLRLHHEQGRFAEITRQNSQSIAFTGLHFFDEFALLWEPEFCALVTGENPKGIQA